MKNELPNRKPTLHKNFDYSTDRYYFVTICMDDMKNFLGKIRNGKIILSSIGNIVEKCWHEIPGHFKNIELDYFQIMPNHLHGILIINSVGDGSPVPGKLPKTICPGVNETTGDGKPIPYNGKISLSNVVGHFKYQATKEINKQNNKPGRKIFQRSFYDRIIRNERELYNIQKYISENPLRWELEKEMAENLDMLF